MLLANQNLIIDQEKLTRYLSVESRWIDMVLLCSEDEGRFITFLGEDYCNPSGEITSGRNSYPNFFLFLKKIIYIQESTLSQKLWVFLLNFDWL